MITLCRQNGYRSQYARVVLDKNQVTDLYLDVETSNAIIW